MRRIATLVAGVVVGASLITPLVSTPAANADGVSDAAAFVTSINALRGGRGLAPLVIDVRLTSVALWWSNQMAASGTLSENPNLVSMVPPGWTMLGENVGNGPNWWTVESAFENSPNHLGNMLQPSYSAVGVGLVSAGGTIWVTEVFTAGITPVPPVTWYGPGNLGSGGGPGAVVGKVTAASAAPGHIDTFWKGADGQLWHGWYAYGVWAPPSQLRSGTIGSDPHALSSAPGHLDVFWRGLDNSLWHDWYNDDAGWQGPAPIAGSGSLSSDPHPVAVSSGIDVFWRGMDGDLWHAWRGAGGAWDGPRSIGAGPLGSAPHPVTEGPGRVDVFWKGTDANLWHVYTGGQGWFGPSSLGDGPLGSDPQPVSAPGGAAADVFWQGTDGGLWHTWYLDGSGWFGPSSIATGVVGSPKPISAGPGQIDVVWQGPDLNLDAIRYRPGAGWSGSYPTLSGPLGSDPVPLSSAPGVIDAFWRGTDNGLWHVWTLGP